MNKKSKEEIEAALSLLKSTLVLNRASMAVTQDGKLIIFDTDKYLKYGKVSGFCTELESLVK